MALQVGGEKQTVTATTSAEMLKTTDASIGEVVDRRNTLIKMANRRSSTTSRRSTMESSAKEIRFACPIPEKRVRETIFVAMVTSELIPA
jgi:phage terminase large subunit GpA-like protein